ncbi:MAG: pilus assembly protein PilP [Desulfobacterales bacterium]|nr:pilus assembly protein PilP [Desulfobacterales bacterium]
MRIKICNTSIIILTSFILFACDTGNQVSQSEPVYSQKITVTQPINSPPLPVSETTEKEKQVVEISNTNENNSTVVTSQEESQKKAEPISEKISQTGNLEESDKKVDVTPNQPEQTNTLASVLLTDTLNSKIFESYNPTGKIDPFKYAFIDERPRITQHKKVDHVRDQERLTALERLDFSQITLVGIVKAEAGNKGLVQDKNSKGYVVKNGNYIGLRSGKVVDILDNCIIINEPLLPVDEETQNSIFEENGQKFINVEGEKYKVQIANIDGKDYYVDVKELKLQKPAGEEYNEIQ